MSADEDRQRTRKARIARLAQRLHEAQSWLALKNVLKGVLDLLADET